MEKKVTQKENGTKTSAAKTARRTFFFSLRWKLLIGFTLLFSIVFALAFYWFYTFATQQAFNRIRTDLLDTLEGGSLIVNGDTLEAVAVDGVPNAAGEAWLAYANADENGTEDAAALFDVAADQYGMGDYAGFSDDPRYQELMNQLQFIHNIEPRAWPYLFVKAEGERKITYVADLYARYDPSKATPFMFTKSSKRSYNGLNELTLRLDDNGSFTTYTDSWGSWISAYRPVFDSDDRIAGAIGIDFEADYVREVQTAIQDKILLAFVLTYAALFILVFLVSRTLTRPIQRLAVSAERLGEGDYSQDMSQFKASGALHDEISTLGVAFAVMAGKVYQREQNLRSQVERLKIEIDEAKKQKQVSEIAETDFFRELSTKAREMRKRHGSGS